MRTEGGGWRTTAGGRRPAGWDGAQETGVVRVVKDDSFKFKEALKIPYLSLKDPIFKP